MKVLQTSRGFGKTQAALQYFISIPGDNKVFIVSTYQEKISIIRQLGQMGFNLWEVNIFTADEWKRNRYFGIFRDPQIVVDDIDRVLEAFVGFSIDMGTIS